MRFILLLFLSFVFTHPVLAQDMLRKHRGGDPTTQLLGQDGKAPVTIEDYANLYYDSCTSSNTDEFLKDYIGGQCACAAAKIPEILSLDDVKTLFTKTKAGDFQQARVMLLGYIPCLYNSVHDFVYDQCLDNNQTRKQFRHAVKVCECYGKGMGDYAASKGQNLIPGFTRNTFDSEKSVPNPLSYIIQTPFFEKKSSGILEQCVMTEERGW